MIKNILTAAVTAAVVSMLFVLVGGDANLGGGTRFPNGISADSTSPSSGEVRGTTMTSTGNVTFSSDVKIGEANSQSDVIYLGAGDGCTALYAAASSTLTTQATSTSFCSS